MIIHVFILLLTFVQYVSPRNNQDRLDIRSGILRYNLRIHFDQLVPLFDYAITYLFFQKRILLGSVLHHMISLKVKISDLLTWTLAFLIFLSHSRKSSPTWRY
ncbi:hypothetical protein GGR54DRAFT_401311 [Hypoxylon sp. NC1633]|nr:hypothetical protein GGR54DRAFT_401311 [Hypoxylon sp. NC1633]